MENIGDVFKIRVGLAELPDTAQYWTLDSVRLSQSITYRMDYRLGICCYKHLFTYLNTFGNSQI